MRLSLPMREILALVESVAACVALICAFGGVWVMDDADRADTPGKVMLAGLFGGLVTVIGIELVMKRWS